MSGKICNYNKNQYTDTRTDFWLVKNSAGENASFSNFEAKQSKNINQSCFVFYITHNDMHLFEMMMLISIRFTGPLNNNFNLKDQIILALIHLVQRSIKRKNAIKLHHLLLFLKKKQMKKKFF